jgi:hypothetical protein
VPSTPCPARRPCWYQFGSGQLPRAVELPADAWAALEPQPSAVVMVPTLAIAAQPEPRQKAPAILTVRVVGERVVPEGLLHVLSDGVCGALLDVNYMLPACCLTSRCYHVASPDLLPGPRLSTAIDDAVQHRVGRVESVGAARSPVRRGGRIERVRYRAHLLNAV